MAYTFDNQLVAAGNRPLEPNRKTSNISNTYTKIASPYVGLLIYSESDKKYYSVTELDENNKIKSYEELSGVAELVDATTRLIKVEKLPEGYAKGEEGGIASLDENKKVPIEQIPDIPSTKLPQYVSEVSVRDYKNSSSEGKTCFPGLGNKSTEAPNLDVIYVDASTEKTYRWAGSHSGEGETIAEKDYIEISQSLALDANHAGNPNAAFPANLGEDCRDDIESIDGRVADLEEREEFTTEELKGMFVEKESGSDFESTKTYVLKNNKQEKLDGILTKTDVQNKLDSIETQKPLSAAKGKALDEKIGKLSEVMSGTSPSSVVIALNELWAVMKKKGCIKISAKSLVASVNVKKQTIQVYRRVNDSEDFTFITNLELNVDGTATIESELGYYYKFVFEAFENVVNVSPITVRASESVIFVDAVYGIPSSATSERVVVSVFNAATDPILVSTSTSGIKVKYKNTTKGISGDEYSIVDGYCEIVVDMNDEYEISVEPSYKDPEDKSITYLINGRSSYSGKADSASKNISFSYEREGMGVYIIKENGDGLKYEDWALLTDEERKDAKFIKLTNTNASFYIDVEYICSNGYATHKYQIADYNYYLPTGFPLGDINEVTYKGKQHTEYIWADWKAHNIASQIMEAIYASSEFARKRKGSDLYAYIPSSGEYSMIRSSQSKVKKICEDSKYEKADGWIKNGVMYFLYTGDNFEQGHSSDIRKTNVCQFADRDYSIQGRYNGNSSVCYFPVWSD